MKDLTTAVVANMIATLLVGIIVALIAYTFEKKGVLR